MDYSVRDSSRLPDSHSFMKRNAKDCAVRVGIVRKEETVSDGTTRYLVEVASGGVQIPVSCILLNKFGGVFNYEEFRIRPWVQNFPSGQLTPASASKAELRSGDVVLIAYLEGQSREGIILGGLNHPARELKTKAGNIEYISEFNGLETQIRTDGSYKITFKGTPVNTTALEIPPTGATMPAPIYGPSAGSYYGFDADGSFVVSDGSQYMKITKALVGGTTKILSGNSSINMGSDGVQSNIGLLSDKLLLQANTDLNIKTETGITAETAAFSLKAINVAIGNDQVELVDSLIKLIDAIGTIVVTSPVGTCTPIMAAPTWAAQVLPIKLLLSTLKSSVGSADSVSVVDAGDITLGDDVGS